MSTSTSIRFWTILACPLIAQTSSDRIQRIVDALPPTVIVKGEPAATTKLADRMAALHVPGVSIAYIHDGKIEWARGFGVTKIGGAAVTADTLFQAASISKPVAAMAVLRLVQAGKLDLDTDVNRYLKSWKLPDNRFHKPVTIRELLTHTAGLTVHGFGGYASGAPLPTLLQVLNGEPPANSAAIRVDTEPGTIWRYSGGGYVIAQQIVQDVTGEAFPKVMHDTVLAPIGMTKSTYEQPLPASRMAEVATPYHPDGQPVPGGPHVYPEMAPAGLWTTPSDLARYAIEVQKSLAGSANHVLSAAMIRQMLTPGMGKWGLGPETGGSAQHPYFTHGGANEGYRCQLIAYDRGDGVAIMTNGDNGGPLMQEIQRSVAREYGWPDFQPVEHSAIKVDAKSLDAYVGAYKGSDAVFMITREGDQLFAQLGGQRKVPVFPETERSFFLKVVEAQISFTSDSLTLHQNGADVIFNKLDEAEGKRIAAETAARVEAAARRFKEQEAAPGSEAAVRRLMEEVRIGKPDYALMSAGIADVIRQQLPDLKATIVRLGALQTVTFKGVGPGGSDIYEVKFENGLVECRIAMTADGKIDGVGFRPL